MKATTFRPRTEPVFGVQRPDGSPTSDAGKKFIRSVNDIGGIIVTIPGTNYMFLSRLIDRGDGDLSPENAVSIQPGEWVISHYDRCFVRSDQGVSEDYELVEDFESVK